jgi:hypothetical protein
VARTADRRGRAQACLHGAAAVALLAACGFSPAGDAALRPMDAPIPDLGNFLSPTPTPTVAPSDSLPLDPPKGTPDRPARPS